MVNFMTLKQSFTLILISVFTGLSQTAGIGGGPIINLCLMLNYEQKISISLTYVFLVGGSLASVWKNSTKINKQTGQSYVSLDLILVTLPMMNSGALLGVMGKNYLSELWVTVLFIIIFLYLIKDIIKNIRKIRLQTSRTQQPPTERSLSVPNTPTTQPSHTDLSQKTGQTISLTTEATTKPKRNKKLAAAILLAILYYTITVLFSVIKGTAGGQPFLPMAPCGIASFSIILIHIIMSYGVSMWIIKRILRQREEKRSGKVGEDEVEIESIHVIPINGSNRHKLVGAGFGAGVLGATLAIGGAPILIPMWLNSGIDHNVASSTTPALILISSLVSFTISAMGGAYDQTPISKILLFVAVSFISSALIKDLLTYLADKYRLKTLVVVLLLVVIILSLLVLVPYQFIKMLNNYDQFARFGMFC